MCKHVKLISQFLILYTFVFLWDFIVLTMEIFCLNLNEKNILCFVFAIINCILNIIHKLYVCTIDEYLVNFVYKTKILLMLVLKSHFIIQYSPLRIKLLIIFNILNIIHKLYLKM